MANNKIKSTTSASTPITVSNSNSTSLVPAFREKFSSIKVEEENLRKTGKVVIYLPSIAKIIAGLKSRDKYIVLFDSDDFIKNSSSSKQYTDEFFVSVDADTESEWKSIFQQIDIDVRNNIPWTKDQYKCWYDEYRAYFYSAINSEEKPHRAVDYFSPKKRARKEVRKFNTYKHGILIGVILAIILIIYGFVSMIANHVRGTEPSLIAEGYQYTIVKAVQSDLRIGLIFWNGLGAIIRRHSRTKTDNEVWSDIERVNNTRDLDKHLDSTDVILIRVIEPIERVVVS